MIELTRDDLITWLDNPVTKGFYKVLKKRRDEAEDVAFNSTLDNYNKSGLIDRSSNELFAYRDLEVMNNLIIQTFHPLYEDLKLEELNPKKDDELEKIKDDSIQAFINNIMEASKNDKN